jgi:hypothetical protein
MNRLYEIFKKPSGPSTRKALLNHTIFSPSQTGETVPLRLDLVDMFGFFYSRLDDVSVGVWRWDRAKFILDRIRGRFFFTFTIVLTKQVTFLLYLGGSFGFVWRCQLSFFTFWSKISYYSILRANGFRNSYPPPPLRSTFPGLLIVFFLLFFLCNVVCWLKIVRCPILQCGPVGFLNEAAGMISMI